MHAPLDVRLRSGPLLYACILPICASVSPLMLQLMQSKRFYVTVNDNIY
jgi:hypothetical protein